jgi:hypothetical protein
MRLAGQCFFYQQRSIKLDRALPVVEQGVEWLAEAA